MSLVIGLKIAAIYQQNNWIKSSSLCFWICCIYIFLTPKVFNIDTSGFDFFSPFSISPSFYSREADCHPGCHSSFDLCSAHQLITQSLNENHVSIKGLFLLIEDKDFLCVTYLILELDIFFNRLKALRSYEINSAWLAKIGASTKLEALFGCT